MRSIPPPESLRLRSEVIDLAKQPALNFFALAQALSKLHDIDPRDLRDLPDRSRLSRRRMYYLLQAGELIRRYGIKELDAEYIGWTKLQMIARHVSNAGRQLTPEEFKKLLALATEHKTRDLPVALKGKRLGDKRVAHFYLTSRERALLNKALVMYGATQRGDRLTGKEEALVKILREVTDPNN